MVLASKQQRAAASPASWTDQTTHELQAELALAHHRSGHSGQGRISQPRLIGISSSDKSTPRRRKPTQQKSTPHCCQRHHHLPLPPPRNTPPQGTKPRSLTERGAPREEQRRLFRGEGQRVGENGARHFVPVCLRFGLVQKSVLFFFF